MARPAVRARILEAAEQQFCAKGYSHTSMDQLAETLGISKRTLYEQVGSKDKLLYGIIREKGRALAKAQADVMRSDKNVIEKIDLVGKTVQQCFGSIWNANLLTDLKRNAPALWKKISDMRREKLRVMWTLILTEGMRKGYFRKDFDIDIFQRAMLGAVEKILEPEYLLNSQYSVGHSRLQVLDIFLNGILTTRGRVAAVRK